ncbi:MAG: hypothetical protein CMB97_08420 [Flavobacteriaceae bacterium]|nr:hypothetical protein [Flavobacteriaceae bacterium]
MLLMLAVLISVNFFTKRFSKIKEAFQYAKPEPATLQNINCRIVAIAKNESAYLAEWIFHHLYFGFSSIHVYYNRCNDQTNLYKTIFANVDNVEIIDGDSFFSQSRGNPQLEVYKYAAKVAEDDGCTHVFFIDIDEFFLPQNLCTTANELIAENFPFDSLSLEWLNQVGDETPFSRVIEEPHVAGIRNRHVKSIYPLPLPTTRFTAHNVIENNLNTKLVDGSSLKPEDNNLALVPKSELEKPIKEVFLLHRFYRSEKEYIALLGRGRPNTKHKLEGSSELKSNRNGYGPFRNAISIQLPECKVHEYKNFIYVKMSGADIQDIVDSGKHFVLDSFKNVLEIIRNSEQRNFETLIKLLKNVKDKEVVGAFEEYKKKIKNSK